MPERRAQREGRDQERRDVEAMAHTLGLLEQVIFDPLDVARLNQGIFAITPQPMNPIDVIQEVVRAFQSAEKSIQTQALPEVILSPTQIDCGR